MRAGSLDREIIIQRATVTLTEAGTPVETWATLVTLRAALKANEIDENQGDQGASSLAVLTFQTRFYPGITLADRLSYAGQPYNIRQVKEIGRRRGLEIRAERLGV